MGIDLKKTLENGRLWSMVQRLDGWYNSITGIGTTRDKGFNTAFIANPVLTDQECSDLFHHDDLAQRICTAIVEEALKRGFQVTKYADQADAQETQEACRAVTKKMEALHSLDRVKEAAIWGRTFGGCMIFLGVKGQGRPERPLDDSKVKELEFLTIIEKRFLQPWTWYSDPSTEKYGRVESYLLTNEGTRTPSKSVVVHETRMISFPGAMTAKREKDTNNGWDYSVLQRVIDTLRKTNMSYDSVIAMMSDASQAVYKLKGLIDAIAEEDQSTLQARLSLMDQMRSTARAVVLDAEDEDFRLIERQTVSGVADLLDKTFSRLAAAARMPMTMLMGMSMGGMSNTGESDLNWWYDSAEAYQEDVLKPALERIARLCALEVAPGTRAEDWEIKFPSLWKLSPAIEADLRAKIAATDQVYVSMGALQAGEVSLSRFGKGTYDWQSYFVNMEVVRERLEAEYAKTPEEAEKSLMTTNSINPAGPPKPGEDAKPGEAGEMQKGLDKKENSPAPY